jgi:hypothetical protein
MKSRKSGEIFALLALAVLFLAACQPAALETANPPAGPDATATQPLEVITETPASVPTGTAVATETAAQVPEGWQVLNDTTRGFSLAYPPEWEVCQVTKYSWAFCEIQKEPEGMGPPPRLYVSAYPQDSTNEDFEIYNFIPLVSIREFMVLPVGESKLREAGAMAPEYFTYTRLPDRMVAGWNAMVIENTRVWEAPPETNDRVIIVVDEGTTYMIGAYYETPEQLALFEQVLDSFQLVP